MAKCEKCGQDNASDANSCTWCGTPLIPVVDPNSIPNRDLGQLISHTFHLYGKNFWQFILIGLPPQILGFIALIAFPDIGPDFSSGFGSEAASEAALEEFADFTRVLVPISILSALAVLIVEGATIHAVGKQYLGQNIDVLANLRRGLSKLLILIAVSILVVLALMVSAPLMLILIGIPLAIFLVISWAFVFQMVMIEGKGPISALGSSYNLVKGSRWRVLGIGIVFILIQIGLQILITIATGVIDDVSQPLASITSSVALAVISPIMFIGLTVVYLDLRARKEGLTLDTLAMEMGERVVGAASSDDLRDV